MVLCAGAMVLPLVYLRATHDEFILPKLLFGHVLLALLALLLLVRWAADGKLVIRRTPLDLPLLAFLATAVVATIFAVNRNVAIFGTYLRYEGLLTLATYAALFWLTAQTLQTGGRGRILVRAMLAGAYLVAIVAIVQWVIAALTTAPGPDADFSYAGLPRASATLSNPTMLGAFLAMLLPAAVGELVEARSVAARILAANAGVLMGIALALTFVRSAWLAALAGVAIAIAAPQRAPARIRLGLVAAGLAVVLAVAGAGVVARGGLPLAHNLAGRVASIGLNVGTTRSRLRVWAGTVGLVASRPLTGYGPDTFGLVYPPFRVPRAPVTLIDKAHSEVLQIAATQGLLGVAAYLWLLAAIALAFWRGRTNQGAAAAIGGVAAYQLWAQANFSWIPATAVYWIFLGAAVTIWGGELPVLVPLRVPRLPALAAATIVGLGLVGLSVAGAARAATADARYESGLLADSRGDLSTARAALAEARSLAPQESRYAFEAGRVAMASADLGQARWTPAREAFAEAARLGTFYSAVYYDLALADLQLGRRAEAVAALQQALKLSPGDPASLDLLRQINGA